MSREDESTQPAASTRGEEDTGLRPLTRRRWLRGAVTATVLSSAGCAFDGSESDATDGRTSTAPSRATPTATRAADPSSTGTRTEATPTETSTAEPTPADTEDGTFNPVTNTGLRASRPLVFQAGTSPAFEIPRETDPFSWIVRTHADEEVTAGRAAADDTAIELDLSDVGYYELCSVWNDVVAVLATFAIVPTEPAPRDPLFGLGTDFTRGQDLDLFPLVDWTGAGVARESLRWQGGDPGGVEPERGTYQFTDGMDRLVDGFESRGIGHLNHLVFNHMGYISEEDAESVEALPETILPYNDEMREGYASYAATLVDHYPAIDHVQVWNEPNFDRFSRGPGGTDPETYRALLKETYRAVTDVRPDVTVIGGPTLGVDLPWHEAVLADGGIDHLDALAIHPYTRPETLNPAFGSSASGEWATLRDLNDVIREYNDGELLPVWITELGWNSVENELGQARLIVRAYVHASTFENLGSLCLYNFQDIYAGDTGEGMKGLLRHPGDERSTPERVAPKPSYVAYAIMTRQLGGATYEGTDDASIESYVYSQGGETVRVVWAEEERDVDFDAAGEVSVVTMLGDESTISTNGGGVTVTVSPSPRYVRGPTTGIR